MAKVKWDESGKRLYETGTDRGVLYPRSNESSGYAKGVAWNGLTAVTESPSGAEETALYANNQKYLSLYSAEELGLTIEAYTFPDEWYECDGSRELAPGLMATQQARKGFGMTYRTLLGNDEQGQSYGYKLHLLYGGMASPSEKSYQTINDSPDAVTFSWEITTVPTEVGDSYKNTALLVIDSTKVDAAKLKALEDILYGTDGGTEGGTTVDPTDPRLPLPPEVITLLS